jgi:hypothetical protein
MQALFVADRHSSGYPLEPEVLVMRRLFLIVGLAFTGLAICRAVTFAEEIPAKDPLRISVFQVDATPPLGSPVAYALARKIEDPLTARGVVLLGIGKPIVLCAVDWINIPTAGTMCGAKIWRKLSALRSIGWRCMSSTNTTACAAAHVYYAFC